MWNIETVYVLTIELYHSILKHNFLMLEIGVKSLPKIKIWNCLKYASMSMFRQWIDIENKTGIIM